MVPFAPGVLCLGGGKAPKHRCPDLLVGESSSLGASIHRRPSRQARLIRARELEPGGLRCHLALVVVGAEEW